MGDLSLDSTVITALQGTGKFGKMSRSTDEDEHSLEMHLPYIYKILSKSFTRPKDFPTLIPILVGNTNINKEREYGSILGPYLMDPSSVFIVSSDFCHWGLRFNYTYYLPNAESGADEGVHLRAHDKPPRPPIYESIGRIDHMAMSSIESGDYESFRENLQSTGNTVCGRHPIGIIMCALDCVKSAADSNYPEINFKFTRYERSSECVKVGDSSVSYASAFAVVPERELTTSPP